MNVSMVSSLLHTLKGLRAAASTQRARRIAAEGLQQLKQLRNGDGDGDHFPALAELIGEVRDSRIQSLRPAAARREPAAADFSPLRKAGLTRRECEVLEWIAAGKRDAEIAAILGISTKTVSKHVEHLLAKLHAETRTGAVSAARDRTLRESARKRGSR